MPGRDAAREHAMLAKVLEASLDPPSPDLAELAKELEAEGEGRQLRTEHVERVFMARLASKPLLSDRLAYMVRCWRGCDDVRANSHRHPPEVLEQLPAVLQMIGNYAGLSISCAELFGLEPVPASAAAATLRGMWEKRELPITFFVKIADSMEDGVDEIFGSILAVACSKLKGRHLMDQRTDDLYFIAGACDKKRGGSPKLAQALVALPSFLPAPNPSAVAANPMLAMMSGSAGSRPPQPGRGYQLQTDSFLGWVLAPTCVDTALYKEQSARHIHFQGLARKTQSAVVQTQNLLRSSMSDVLEQAKAVVNPLLRAGEGTRDAVLSWLGTLITGTEARTKSANTLDQGGGPNHFVDSLQNAPMPMQQNLDMRLQMQAMQAQMLGFATPGMALNTLWLLLDLVSPIKLSAVESLDPYYILREGTLHATILGGFSEEARFGDADDVAKVKADAIAADALSSPVKFTTQVFWLAVRAMHVLLVPVLKEDLCFAVGAGYFQSRDPSKMEACLGEHFLHQTILESSAFLQSLATLLNLEIAFCLCAALPHRAAEVVAGKLTSGSVLTSEISPQWQVLPSCILEDLIETLEYFVTIRPPGQPQSELFTHVKPDLLLPLVTFMLGSGGHVKNPNLRGKATTILMTLTKQRDYLHLLETSPILANDIVPGCIRVFTAVEKTKQSYYDIRMQLKYQLRIPIMELMEKVLPIESHQKSLLAFAHSFSDEFLKFLNQLMNDATMQISEGLDTLQEIRRIVREQGEAGLQRPSAEALSADEQNEGGEDVYRRSRADPKEHCKTYMKMGHRTMRTLWSIIKEAPIVIVSKLNVLQQLLHSCLNACLDRLVGPKCLELKMQKGAANDFEEYNFKPKEMIQMVAEMYIYVARSDKDRVQKLIVEDGRSYRPKTFQKAVQVLKREQMIAAQMLQEFESFVQDLNNLSASQEAALANITIPDDFLDPIMSEIMEDPVLLPSSNTIMDRKVIERHIMSNDDDPFNRMPLSVKDLVPQDELRARIQEFCQKHGIVAGG
mmetsp:Transcript_110713/g.319814  ORF Transcript_110713/g.319814 Transcript_110713/m.319814 type:complete len:1018 (-) Transcript_110713:151-3204(-)